LADKKILSESSTKKIYGKPEDDQLVQEFIDEIVTRGKKVKVKNKGMMANAISSALFEYLEGYNIPTYYLGKSGDSQMSVKNVETIPVDIIVRNTAAGSYSDRSKIKEGTPLEFPVIEFFVKDQSGKDNHISESDVYDNEYVSQDEFRHMTRLVFKINAVLKDYFERRDINLIDIKLNFGKTQNQLMLADEILPDSCRLWDIKAGNGSGKKRFSLEKGNADEAYKEIFHRIFGE